METANNNLYHLMSQLSHADDRLNTSTEYYNECMVECIKEFMSKYQTDRIEFDAEDDANIVYLIMNNSYSERVRIVTDIVIDGGCYTLRTITVEGAFTYDVPLGDLDILVMDRHQLITNILHQLEFGQYKRCK